MSSTYLHPPLQPVVITLTNSAWAAYRSGQRQTALSLCQQSLAITKHNPSALHLLGLLHAEAKEFKVAERHLLKSLEFSPSPNVWNDLAIMHRSQGRLQKAEMAIRKAISLSTDISSAYYHAHLANIQTQAGHLKDAIASYRQALILRPDWPEVCNNIGELLLVMNDLAGAEEAFRQAIRLNSNLEHPYQNLGITLFNRGLHEEALASLCTAIQISPSALAIRSNKIMMMTYVPRSPKNSFMTKHLPTLLARKKFQRATPNGRIRSATTRPCMWVLCPGDSVIVLLCTSLKDCCGS